MPIENMHLILISELVNIGCSKTAEKFKANPQTVDLFTGDTPLIEVIIKLGASDLLALILEYSDEKIDFTKTQAPAKKHEKTSYRYISWLQYACLLGSTDIIEKIQQYMEKNHAGFNMKGHLNEPFMYPIREKDGDRYRYKQTNLGALFFLVVSSMQLMGNYEVLNESKDIESFICRWMAKPKGKNLVPNLLENSDAIIVFEPITNFEYCLKYLDMGSCGHTGHNLVELAKEFLKGSQDLAYWENQVKPNLSSLDVEFTGKPKKVDGRTVIQATVKSRYGTNPITTKIAIERMDMVKAVLDKAELTHLYTGNIQKTLERQEQQLATLSSTPDAIVAQIKENLKDDPTYLEIFNNLCIDLSSLLTLKRAAKLGILKMQNSVKGTEHLQNINSLMAPFFEGISPGAVAIPMAINALLDMVNEIESKEQAKQLSAIQTDPRYLAIAIAVTLTEGLKRVYGNNPPKSYIKTSCLCWSSTMRIEDRLVNDVKAQLTTMGEFGSFHDAIAHLSAKAMKTIPTLGPVAPSTPQASSSSSASNDSKAQLATLRL